MTYGTGVTSSDSGARRLVDGMDEITARDDQQLLDDHVAGDSQAFSELFRRHSDRLWAVALRTCRDQEDAADALQEAMISAFRRAESFRGDAKVTTWLHRIVVNACLDRLRARKSKPTVPLPETEPDLGTRDARDHIDEHVTRMTVLEALDRLPEEQRLALTLVDLQGCSVEEASKILNVPDGTVKSRCFRGRSRMHELLRNPAETAHVTPDNAGGNNDVREVEDGNR